jgi:multiple antibiotic resistance protein|tara:strand:- start:2425 stop:3021 length:597 start_codon:yes stop_codon:yes gene_type:complete
MSTIADINIMLFLQAMITLLAILDPVGNIPVFSSLTSKLSKKERVKTVNKAFLIATGILIGFGFFGGYLLILLGITMNDLKLISGLILLIFSIDYVLGRNVNYLQKNSETNLAVFPLAIPILAGPGSISYVLVMPGLFLKFFVIILSILICWYSIRLGSGLLKYLGKDGSQAISRIMGLLIGAVAIRLIREGIFELII